MGKPDYDERRRGAVRTRRDRLCTTGTCSSTLTRTVWDGDQVLYEIRAQGGAVSAAVMERDGETGAHYGRVAYTHGPGIDAPLDLIRIGYTPTFTEDYGLDDWTGPTRSFPQTGWCSSAMREARGRTMRIDMPVP